MIQVRLNLKKFIREHPNHCNCQVCITKLPWPSNKPVNFQYLCSLQHSATIVLMLSNTNLCSFKEYQLTGVHQDTCTSAWRISSYRRTSDKSLSTSLQVLPLWPLKVVQWAAITTRIFKYRSRRWITSLHYAGKSDMDYISSALFLPKKTEIEKYITQT